MAGDTKLSARWQPNLHRTNDEQWRRPIRQVLTYSNDIQCRYGFLITDNELVVIQFAREHVESEKGFEYQDPKYQVIPWDNEGEAELTVKSGLFYLCMMAGYGSRHICCKYPKLHTWWRLADGTFQHNTSGFTKKQLSSKDKTEDPDDKTQQTDNTQIDMDDAKYEDQGSSYQGEDFRKGK